jgi:fatty acid-binding protein DegV
LLQVKPILQLKDGMAAPFEQERTKKRATSRLMEIACEQVTVGQDAHLCVMHIDALDEARAVCNELETKLGIQHIPIYLLPPAIVVHAGPKALAVGFFVQ